MGIRTRIYIFENDSTSIRHIPRRICEALINGLEGLPDYANTRQRVAQIIVDNEGGKPVKILDAQGSYWQFDDEGKIHQGLQQSLREFMEFAFSSEAKQGTVIDLTNKIKRKQHDEKHRWTLTNEDLDRISADLWPSAGGSYEKITAVKGEVAKKPSVTPEAKSALSDIAGKIESIYSELTDLSEPSLKGLAFEARRCAGFKEEPNLWLGLAAEADRCREILSVRRSGKGEWYAVVKIWRRETSNSTRSIDVKFEKCSSKRLAAEAGQRLLTENAYRLSDDTILEAKLYSVLEWSPAED